MSTAQFHQDLRVISNSIDAISTLNGSIKFDTQPSGVLDIKHTGTTVMLVKADGSIEIKAKPSRNLHPTTSDGGKTVISDLELLHEHEYTEEVVVSHDIKSTSVTVFNPNSGSFQVLIDSIEDGSATSSDCSVCAFIVKKKAVEEGLVHTLCTTTANENENLQVSWL